MASLVQPNPLNLQKFKREGNDGSLSTTVPGASSHQLQMWQCVIFPAVFFFFC